MSQHIDRVVERNAVAEAAAVTTMIFSLQRITLRFDALVVFPGLGEWWRICDAIRTWRSSEEISFLLIAGHNTREKTSLAMNIETLKAAPFFLPQWKLDGVHVENHAEHTKEQAEWTAEKVQRLNIESVALYAPPYHITRAYLTLLKALLKRNITIPIIPAPTPVPPHAIVPEFNVDGWSMVAGEAQRIEKYQAQGDVASAQELADYLQWLWSYHFRKFAGSVGCSEY